MNNIIQMDVEQCLDMLQTIYGKIIENDHDFSKLSPFFLWGTPGIGKSAIVHHLKDYIEENYHLNVHLLDLRLYEYTPVDLKGVPYATEDKQYTKWLKPQILHLKEDKKSIHILFLDELLMAKESVQAVALQLVLERRIDQFTLPSNTIVIAASNRDNDHSYIIPMSRALANRFAHVEIICHKKSWINYAYQNNIDYRVISYIQFRPSILLEEKPSGYAYCTPRSWEKVSYIMALFNHIEDAQKAIACVIGEGNAYEFVCYCQQQNQLSPIEDILTGKGKVPQKNDTIYLMIGILIDTIKKNHLTVTELDYIFEYVYQFPDDFCFTFLLDIKEIIKDNIQIHSLASYQKISIKMGKYL